LLVPLTWVSGLGLSRVSASAGAWTGFATQGSNGAWRSFRSLDWRDRDDHWGQTFDAATYPQSVALARLLVSPRWRERILDKSWPWHDEFVAELCRSPASDRMNSESPLCAQANHLATSVLSDPHPRWLTVRHKRSHCECTFPPHTWDFVDAGGSQPATNAARPRGSGTALRVISI
jgi:hypothetical protein